MLSWAVCLLVLFIFLCEGHVFMFLSMFEILVCNVEIQRYGQLKASAVLSGAVRHLQHVPSCC